MILTCRFLSKRLSLFRFGSVYVWKGGFQCFSFVDQGLGFQAQPGDLYCWFLSHQHIKQRGLNFDSARLWPLFGVTQVSKGVNVPSC